jgi:hypothetical protein
MFVNVAAFFSTHNADRATIVANLTSRATQAGDDAGRF